MDWSLFDGWIALLLFIAVVRVLVAFVRKEELAKPARDVMVLILVVCGIGFVHNQQVKQKAAQEVAKEAGAILAPLLATMQLNHAVVVGFEQGTLSPDEGKIAAAEIIDLRDALHTSVQLRRFPELKTLVVNVIDAAHRPVNKRAKIVLLKERSKEYFARNDKDLQRNVVNMLDKSIQEINNEDEKLKAEVKNLCVYLEHPEEPLTLQDLQAVKDFLCSGS